MPPSTTLGASPNLAGMAAKSGRLFQRWLYEHCTKLECACKRLIINELLVEAAGVELSSVLRTRNLLILGTATRDKKAPLPDPLYVYCTKMLSLLSPADPHSDNNIPWIRRAGSKKTPSFLRARRA
jgi:hypothetical protein